MKEAVRKVYKRIPSLKHLNRWMHNRAEYNKTMRLNRKYKRAIAPLHDSIKLTERISALKEECTTPDKATYYVISQSNEKVGILGYVNVFLPHIAYAISKGWIPVVDMKKHKYIYSPEGEDINVWELFFKQPCDIGLNDITYRNIIHCNENLWYRWMPNTCPLMSEADISLWASIYAEFVRLNHKADQYVKAEQNEILLSPDKTVGVIYRGTTYTKGQAKGHPIQPTMKMLADKVQQTMDDFDCDWIYLASDEKSIVDYFNNRFPNKVLINQRVYYDEVDGIDYSKYNSDGTDITGKLFNRRNNNYLIGIEYISSINLVANCACLVAGACGGTTAALYMNGGRYRNKYIFELGKYGFDPVPED